MLNMQIQKEPSVDIFFCHLKININQIQIQINNICIFIYPHNHILSLVFTLEVIPNKYSLFDIFGLKSDIKTTKQLFSSKLIAQFGDLN